VIVDKIDKRDNAEIEWETTIGIDVIPWYNKGQILLVNAIKFTPTTEVEFLSLSFSVLFSSFNFLFPRK
jgi:hypothetical protein